MLRFTISYGRFGNGIQKPDAADNSDDCDWCLNTVYVKPDATNLSLCPDKKLLAFAAIYNTPDGGFTSLMFKKPSLADRNDNFGQFGGNFHGQTSRGMMCMFADIFFQ